MFMYLKDVQSEILVKKIKEICFYEYGPSSRITIFSYQAYQIATLIKDYIEAVRGPVSPAVAEAGGARAS